VRDDKVGLVLDGETGGGPDNRVGINAWEVGNCPSTGGNVWLLRAMYEWSAERAGQLRCKVEEGRISALGFSILTPPMRACSMMRNTEEFRPFEWKEWMATHVILCDECLC